MQIFWSETGDGMEGMGPSGHSYLLKPSAHPSGMDGTSWLVFQDNEHGYTLQDRETAALVASHIEALTFGREQGFERLDHMGLLDALTMLRAMIRDIESEDEDEPFAIALAGEQRFVEALMATRRISAPSLSIH